LLLLLLPLLLLLLMLPLLLGLLLAFPLSGWVRTRTMASCRVDKTFFFVTTEEAK
jgi:hypothetical protein